MSDITHPATVKDDHDHGLAHDLRLIDRQLAERRLIERRLIERRRALVMMASAGTVGFLAACGSDTSLPGGIAGSSSGSTSATSTTSASSGGTTTSTTSSTTSTSASGGQNGQCTVVPAETAGPFPGDGSNTTPGTTSNILTSSGVVRGDVRPSFINTTTVATGVRVDLTITVVNVNASCARIAGYAVYLWQCDRNGNYSLYDLPNESYLRGVQVTDANGQVTFTTVFPGCYAGRYPHMHFEVFSSLTNATAGRFAVLTSQLVMGQTVSAQIYADTTTYPGSASRFASLAISNDSVFGDNTPAQISAMTPIFEGAPGAGYTAAVTVGIAR